MAKKTSCPISRAQFRANARPLEITINGVPMQVPVKEFSTGSLGWYLNSKTSVDIGGSAVSVQIGLNLAIVGSKELPQDAAAPAAKAEEAHSAPAHGAASHGGASHGGASHGGAGHAAPAHGAPAHGAASHGHNASHGKTDEDGED